MMTELKQRLGEKFVYDGTAYPKYLGLCSDEKLTGFYKEIIMHLEARLIVTLPWSSISRVAGGDCQLRVMP